jgi:hypothetical protein
MLQNVNIKGALENQIDTDGGPARARFPPLPGYEAVRRYGGA